MTYLFDSIDYRLCNLCSCLILRLGIIQESKLWKFDWNCLILVANTSFEPFESDSRYIVSCDLPFKTNLFTTHELMMEFYRYLIQAINGPVSLLNLKVKLICEIFGPWASGLSTLFWYCDLNPYTTATLFVLRVVTFRLQCRWVLIPDHKQLNHQQLVLNFTFRRGEIYANESCLLMSIVAWQNTLKSWQLIQQKILVS